VIERARTASFADALAAAALGLVAAGLVVTGDGLVSAAKQTPGSSAMDWNDRLLLGLWSFRLEHTLWFTLGLVLLWLALAWGATLEGRAPELARLAGGVAVGFVLLAAAVVIGSTIVAISGSIGGGVLEVVYTRDQRIFTWLLQASTAVALIVTWSLAGGHGPVEATLVNVNVTLPAAISAAPCASRRRAARQKTPCRRDRGPVGDSRRCRCLPGN